MGKFLIIIGVIMMVGGFAGTMIGTFSGIAQIPDLVNLTEDAARYCNEGETLATSEGASVYTPGQGYGRNVRYFCEDAQGNQREVTAEFVEGLFGQTDNIFNSVFGGISTGFPFILVIMLGTLFLIVGVMIAVMRRMNTRPQMINPYGMSNYYPPSTGVPMGGQPMMNTPSQTQQPYVQQPYTSPSQPPAAPPPAANAPQDLATKLRQLEEARNAGLISMAEYQATRQRILDEMKNTPS